MKPLLGRAARAAVVVCLFSFAGCASTDLGNPCTLVTSNPDGGHSVTLTEGQLPTTQADYVSFASADCAEVCVRDSNQQRTGDNSKPAAGYCSRGCEGEGTQGSCGAGYICRALLLDTVTLKALCDSNPSKCPQFSGDPTSLFCAKDS